MHYVQGQLQNSRFCDDNSHFSPQCISVQQIQGDISVSHLEPIKNLNRHHWNNLIPFHETQSVEEITLSCGTG